MKQVLIVDDEPKLLLSIRSGFEHNDRFQLMTAENGREALDILSGGDKFDLVVTDLRMPVMDGVELLAAMSESFPEVSNIVMTAFGTSVMEQQLQKGGTLKVLEKPLDIDALEHAVNKALDVQDEYNGGLTGISLVNFLQIVAMEQKTTHLKVFHPAGRTGSIFFCEGRLIDAAYDNMTGEEAVFEMLEWERVILSMRQLAAPLPESRIQSELMQILLEAAHRKDLSDEAKPLDLVKREFFRIQQQETHKQHIETGGDMPGIKDLLKAMADEMDGVLAIQVTGMDGITIALHNPTGTDVEAFSAKFAMVMKLVERSVDSLKGMGDFEENLVQSQNAWILTRFITPQYYVGIAVSRDGTLGNVRLVAQRYLDQLRKSLQA
jgi:CheY-like chemotaxis protein